MWHFDIREKWHQEVVLLEVSNAAIIPKLLGLGAIALDCARGRHLRAVHSACNRVEQSGFTRSRSTENDAY